MSMSDVGDTNGAYRGLEGQQVAVDKPTSKAKNSTCRNY
jgi:hypothetical protein